MRDLAAALGELGELIDYARDAGASILTIDQALDRVQNVVDYGFYPWQANEADGLSTTPYFIVGCDGQVATNARVNVGPAIVVSALNGATAISG